MELRSLAPEFGELLGAFIGDGFISVSKNRHYRLGFSGDSRTEIPYYETVIVPLLKQINSEVRSVIYCKQDSQSFELRIDRKKFVELMCKWFEISPGPRRKQ